jgi:membrane-bound serine protease (ClpP class)
MIPIDASWMPNVYYLGLVLGLWTAAMALATPGSGLLEAGTLVLLAVAGVGMTIWPVNLWAFLPLTLGLAAFVISLWQRRRAGPWLLASALLVSLGSIFLYERPGGGPAVQPLLAVVMTAATVGLFYFGVRRGIEVQLAPPTVDAQTVIGQVGEARSTVHRSGTVYVGGELWSARSATAIPSGAPVRVRGLDGLVLEVEQVETAAAGRKA